MICKGFRNDKIRPGMQILMHVCFCGEYHSFCQILRSGSGSEKVENHWSGAVVLRLFGFMALDLWVGWALLMSPLPPAPR